jgi:hypothetical protein
LHLRAVLREDNVVDLEVLRAGETQGDEHGGEPADVGGDDLRRARDPA